MNAPPEIFVRQASLSDIGAFCAAIVGLADEARDSRPYSIEPTTENAVRLFDAVVAPAIVRGDPVFVAEDSTGEPLGVAINAAIEGLPTQQKALFGYGTFVFHKYRRMGVSKLLRAKVVEAARRLGYSHIVGAVDASNPVGLEVYRKMGFVPAATTVILKL